mmetsp:Transcript_8242/g.16507  ORF Transcript_8242/g.16507 Transcript_8242/m.16507 type:complete len:304 (+) Transcript_8242:430-1341(+)|eukprot:CAMPEP_0182486484 /NCGR_PEP_ID=MMETSP1319-20130603/47163_1 /TAXON_ID=172717 /ORGANISM="Bolidomonas pacifica, Strain RCC208" /LENGTH=303 /DNA_ID=CAMNT_0024688569 /DNA_START=348 /DNA_END=1259 /DNA_ORIENTATION=-
MHMELLIVTSLYLQHTMNQNSRPTYEEESRGKVYGYIERGEYRSALNRMNALCSQRKPITMINELFKQGRYCRTPLISAIRQNAPYAMIVAINNKAKLHPRKVNIWKIKEYHGCLPLHIAATHSNCLKTVQFTLRADPSALFVKDNQFNLPIDCVIWRIKKDPSFRKTPIYKYLSNAVGWHCHGLNLLLSLHRQHLTLWLPPLPASPGLRPDHTTALAILGTCMVAGTGLRHIIHSVLGYAFGVTVTYHPMSTPALRKLKARYLGNHIGGGLSDDESEGEYDSDVFSDDESDGESDAERESWE